MRLLRISTLFVTCAASLVMGGLVLGVGASPAAALTSIVNCSTSGGSATLATALAGTSTLIAVRGTCYGNFTIARSLTLLGPAILDGTGYSGKPVLTVTTGTVVLTDLTVRNGNNASNGGGISNAGSLTIISGAVSNNDSVGFGGGISNNDGIVTVIGTTLSNDKVTTDPSGEADGGGIANNGGTLNISGSTLSGNVATSTGYGSIGGAIYSYDGTLNISYSILSGNVAANTGGGDALGGAISSGHGTMTMTESTVTGNMATGTYGSYGGGINNAGYSDTGSMSITDSTLSNNSVVGTYYGPSSGGGANGGGLNNWATGAVSDSTVTGNSATTNSTYSLGGVGGGLNNFGTLTIAHTTIVGNNANSGSASAASINDSGYTTTVVASIVAKGSAGPECDGIVTDAGYNIDDDGTCGFTGTGSISHSTTLDGTLGPLSNNGGPTETVTLLRGSPAINQVTLALDCAGRDQRGISWPKPCDMGAIQALVLPTRR